MATKPVVSNLNASTIDILNVIRANANYEYQSLVPEVTQASEIAKVGQVITGYPALANQFLNSLINRIALVRVKTANFYNQYADLKKGYLQFGETVEEVFVNIAKAREFAVDKAESREYKRTIPDVRSAFHTMNWKVQYPVTIQDQDLKQAFLSMDGVQDLIARIVDAVYTAQEYDEFLLFKYLMIKAITKGQMKPIAVDDMDIHNAAIEFRGASNLLTFMSNEYNASGVTTVTPKEDQYIFMDAHFNAQYDVNVLASAFNMDKADFIGRLKLIDRWDTFDNERFDVIRAASDMIEEVTQEELDMMKDVIGVLIDREWFQIYDNNIMFTEKYAASGLYWNYFLNSWKTVSSSPFSNAVVFVKEKANIENPQQITVEVTDKTISEQAVTLTVVPDLENATLVAGNVEFVQTKALTQAGVGVHKYGALLIPGSATGTALTLVANVGGDTYQATTTITASANVGTTVTLEKQVQVKAKAKPKVKE